MALENLGSESRQVLVGAIMDIVLSVMLVLSVILNCVLLGKPLKEKNHKKHKSHEKKVYGGLAEEHGAME